MPDSCPKCSARVPGGARFCQVCGAATAPSSAPARPSARKKAAGASSQWMIWLAGTLVILLMAGLSIGALSRRSHQAADLPAASAPLTAIEGAGPMPGWLAAADRSIIADYDWAASHHNELQYFPCFCGCFNSAGHVSNSECYYKRDKNKAILAYDGHAYG